MNKKFFKNGDDIVDECELLVEEDHNDAEDRANISAFYNGRETMSECEAEQRGVREMTNHLFGHNAISTASNQISSITNKSPSIFDITFTEGPMEKRAQWSDDVKRELNYAIVQSGRLNSEWKSAAGEATLFGRCHLLFPDTEDWCPVMRRVYVPRGSKVTERPQFVCVRDRMSLRKLYQMKEHALEAGDNAAWKLSGISSTIKMLEDNFEPGVSSSETNVNSFHTPDEEEHDLQESNVNSKHRVSIPVYYMFTARPEEPGCPYDLSIVCRFSSRQRKTAEKNSVELNPLLYDRDRVFKSHTEFIHSFFVDISIGGESTWHRTEGLGHLNYDADVDTEEFFNAAMQGSKDNLRRMFRISNAADRETLERWIMGEEFSNVIPEGVEVVEGTKNPNFQYAFTTMQMLQGLTRQNANASISNSDLGNKVDELEVQALERQGRSAEAIGNRMNDIYLCWDRLGNEIVSRFLNQTILPIDSGYEEISYFQEKMKELKIPLEFMAVKVKGRFKNISVRVNRVAGDGDSVREQMANNFLMQAIGQYSPQSQKLILRKITASQTRDHDLAEQLVPFEDQANQPQLLTAQNENDASYANGISSMFTGQPYTFPLGKNDVHADHLPVHIMGLQSILALGQLPAGWTEKEMEGFKALGRHAMLHVNELKKRNNGSEAREWEAALQQLSGVGENMAKALAQKREQEQQQIDPKDAAKLQIDAGKLQLAKEKEKAIQDDRTIKNTLKAQDIATKNSQSDAKLSQGDRKLNRELMALEQDQIARQEASKEVLAGEREGQGNKTQ